MRWFLLLSLAACAEQDAAFPDDASFKKAQEEAGFVVLGTFGAIRWPATVVEERTAENEISFKTADGQASSYPGYDGYTLKLVRLRGTNGNETVRIYRSKSKR